MHIVSEGGHPANKAELYQSLGILYHHNNNLPKAIEWYEKGLNIATKTGHELVIFRACENLERCHLALGNLLKASEYRKKRLPNRVGALTEEATEGSACNLQVTPPEMAQKRARTEGGTPVRKNPKMSIGQGRSGKTRLKKSLKKTRLKKSLLSFKDFY